jgi:hypothetical protein
MILPERVTADWIATLESGELVAAETMLHSEFVVAETREKARSGERYALLQGPAALVNAWLRWQLVSNEARSRGLVVRHPIGSAGTR